MNNAATHLVTNVVSWVEREESIVVAVLKKALRCIGYDIETITLLCLLGVCTVGIIVGLSQLNPYFNLISCCD